MILEIIKDIFLIIGIGIVLAYWAFCVRFGWSRIKDVTDVYFKGKDEK